MSTNETKTPNGNITEIQMNFGDKSIEIHFVEGIINTETGETRNTFPELHEVLREKKPTMMNYE